MTHEVQSLRLELKEWEKAFAEANDGRKASREDIKRHPEIASKYKVYNRFRTQCLNSSGSPSKSATQLSIKRNTLDEARIRAETPQKRLKHDIHSTIAVTALDQSPHSAHSSPTQHRKSIGPTPQKNGRLLGIFDLLSPASNARMPSKRSTLYPLAVNSVMTPSKQQLKDVNLQSEQVVKRCSRSPPSASKQSYLASFLTPSARRTAGPAETPKSRNSISKLRFDDTPAYLRRDSRICSQSQQLEGFGDSYEMEIVSFSPAAVRMRPKVAVKGLSAPMQGLRDTEDAQLDEELELLREMEGENTEVKRKVGGPKNLIGDSQIPEMPLGPDGHGDEDEEDWKTLEQDSKDRGGKPLKVWKKKGQKRTTRKVVMKPNMARWKPEPEWNGGIDKDDGEEISVVEETQVIGVGTTEGVEQDVDIATDKECTDIGVENRRQSPNRPNSEEAKQQIQGKEKQESIKKKRKVSTTAHANYRALKIKNKQSKAKRGGKFGRRR